jgi:hypothetical protein
VENIPLRPDHPVVGVTFSPSSIGKSVIRVKVRIELNPISPIRPTLCRPGGPRKPSTKVRAELTKEAMQLVRRARDYAKRTAGRSANKQKTSKVYLMVLRRPGLLEGRSIKEGSV